MRRVIVHLTAATLSLAIGLVGASVRADESSGEAKASEQERHRNIFAGRVLDSESQAPVAGAIVAIADADDGWLRCLNPTTILASAPDDRVLLFFRKRNGLRAADVVTGEKGRFRIDGLAKGAYNLIAAHETKGFTLRQRIELSGRDVGHDLVLQPPVRIKGRIKGMREWAGEIRLCRIEPGGEMESQVDLSQSIEIGADGSFAAGPLPAVGEWRLVVQNYVLKQGYSAVVLSAPFSPKPGETSAAVVDLTVGASLKGEVRGPKNEALYGVSVIARAMGDSAIEIGAVTDKEGKYVIHGLPAGEYELKAQRWAVRTAPG